MELELDERKRRSNLAKQAIDFAALDPMFAGWVLEEYDQRRDYGETRIKAIGELDGVILSVCLHVARRPSPPDQRTKGERR